ncbi:hypothetical protein MY4038_008877 [Beauveria bassiana]
MPAISPRYKVAKAQRSAAMSRLRERLKQLKAERDILRKRKKKVTPTLRAIEGLEEELEHYEKMDLDDSEKNSRREARIKIKMRKTWKHCKSSGDSSMSMKRNRGEKRALTELRPDSGTFRLTGIQGVVVAPDSDFRALLRKYWKIDTKTDIKKDIKKDENTKRKCPWIQIKVQYVDTADDGDGIVTLNEKLYLAILRAYIHNQEHFDDSPSKGN